MRISLRLLGGDGCATGTVGGLALGVEKIKRLLQHYGVHRVAQESAFPLHLYQALLAQLLEMVRERRASDPQFAGDVADDQTMRARLEQEGKNAQPRLGADGAEAACEPGEVSVGDQGGDVKLIYISMILK